MKTRLIAILILCAGYAFADTYPRNTAIDIKHYTFKIDLNDSTDVVSGEATIQFLVINPISDFEIDLANLNAQKKGMVVSGVWMGGTELKFTHANDRLKISLPAQAKTKELISITIKYSGTPIDGLIISKNKFGDRTFFGDNWPNRAHNWLPCMDHPYDKAGVDFIVTAPPHYTVIASGVKKEESYLKKRQKLTHWHEEVDIPTKVMVIGVARFAIQSSGAMGCVPVESWIYPQNREAGFIDYEPAAKILDFFQQQVGPYSYKKLANVQSTTIYGGMENASNIFYYENSVTGKKQIDDLLAHEIAHQWFGNSASENDWHHVWLSEGFATYFTHVYNELTYGQAKAQEMRLADRQEVLQFNKKNPGPVVNPTITDYVKLLSPQVYQRGGWVLHMLRKEIGEDAFWKGIRDYYTTYQNSNALSADLQKVMEKASGRQLDSFFQQWLYRAEVPNLKTSWTVDKQRKSVNLVVDQVQPGLPFEFALEVGLVNEKGELRVEKVRISQKNQKITLSVGGKIQKIVLDPQVNLLLDEIIKN